MNKSFSFDFLDKEITEINHDRIVKVYKNILIFKTKNVNLFTYLDKNLEKKFSARFLNIIENNYGLTYSDTYVFKISLDDSIMWEQNINDEIDSLIGVKDKNLWIYTKSGRLIALDVETGKILKRISGNPKDSDTDYAKTTGLGDVYLNEKDNNIYSMNATEVKKINTQNFEVEENYNFREFDLAGMGKYEYVFSPLLQGQYFTFLGQKFNEQGIRHIGLFDYLERKLVWEYEVISAAEKKNGNTLIRPEPLRIGGNRLYVKDIKDTLYIFEKEETIS